MSLILNYAYATTDIDDNSVMVTANDEHSVRKLIDSFSEVEQKDISKVDKSQQIFKDAKVSGRLKFIYAGYNQKKDNTRDNYATAIGGTLKYELAQYRGFNTGIAFTTSQDLVFATGDKNKNEQNSELSSSDGSYTELSQAYINYEHKGINVRVGRQVIDTPLADSDEIRMIQNTFEAYLATYELNDFEFMAGNLQRWQGYDANLDDKWSKTGEDGTWIFGVTYETDVLNASTWYYNISKSTEAIYADFDLHYKIDENILIHSGVQYLNEKEIDNSGVRANIYGVMSELSLYDFSFSVAYNKSDKKSAKQSFSGFGGGTMYTSMDTMILDNIANDRDVQAVVYSLEYTLYDCNFFYSHGDFYGDVNSAGVKEHIREHDTGFEYSLDESFVLAAVYVHQEDKQSSVKTENDWDRIQVMMKYDF